MQETDYLNIKRLIAEKIRLRVGYAVPSEVVKRAEIQSWADDITESLIVELDTYFVGMAGDRVCVLRRWPQTWWDAVKERWFPVWAKRRWPVQYEVIDIDEPLYSAVCPHVDVPDKRPHLEWLMQESKA